MTLNLALYFFAVVHRYLVTKVFPRPSSLSSFNFCFHNVFVLKPVCIITSIEGFYKLFLHMLYGSDDNEVCVLSLLFIH